MSSTESFDDLEQTILGRIEDALREAKGELEERLQGVRERLEAIVDEEMAAVRQEAEVEAEKVATAEAALAEAEEFKVAALAEAEEARVAALTEAEEAKAAALAEAEEAKAAALAAAEAAARDAAIAAVDESMGRLRQAVAAIDDARSQSDVLQALLHEGSSFAPRTALFLAREDGVHGWSVRGFDRREDDFRNLHFDFTECSAWSRLGEGRGTVELSGDDCIEVCRRIDGSMPLAGVLIPLVLRDRLAAALYADRADQDKLDTTALQLLTYIAAQALETLPLRERPSTATLRFATEAPAEEPGLELWPIAAPAEPEPVEETLGEPAEETWQESVAPEPIQPTEFESAEDSGFAMEEVALEIEPGETIATVAAEEAIPEEVDVEPEPIIEPSQEVAPEPVEESWGAPAEPLEDLPAETAGDVADAVTPAGEEAVPPPLTEVEAPPKVEPGVAAAIDGAEVAPPEDVDGPGWAFTTRRFSSEVGDEAAQEEARRLARLLVTEIKLYNEEQVEEGRRNRNVYQALREDIDRSRQIYEERIDETVRAETDFFHDELVRILAGGDADLLGM